MNQYIAQDLQIFSILSHSGVNPPKNAIAAVLFGIFYGVQSPTMNIAINGENRTFGASINLKQLISELGLENKRLAIEVNQTIVPRSEYETYLLKDDDKLEIVQAIGGG